MPKKVKRKRRLKKAITKRQKEIEKNSFQISVAKLLGESRYP
ncbi:hypothetical protein [Bacillus sp. MRMR6]|nr:hypothetical protein [Bacillus sp. MRMR6]